MPRSIYSGFTGPRFRLGILCIFLLVCAAGGGASRPDTLSLLYVRPLGVLAIAGFVLSPGPWHIAGLKPFFVILAAIALLMIAQLLPLPPALWLSLPGHQRFAEAAVAAGIAQPWRPISLTPDLTVNSLLALLPPLVCLGGMASLEPDHRRRVLPVVIGIAAASILLGIVQLTSGGRGAAYLYRVTHEASAVGLFANRNHQGTLLAMTFPMLRAWHWSAPQNSDARRMRGWIAAILGILLVPMLLVTGSRTGIAIGVLGIASAFLVAPVRLRQSISARGRLAMKLGFVIVPVAIGGLIFLFGRATALQRLLSGNIDDDARVLLTPTSVSIAKEFFPWGTGFGSFDTVFRIFEPNWSLDRTYFNHAHNDFLELAITSGLPGVVLLLCALFWFARRSIVLWNAEHRHDSQGHIARCGFFMLLFALLASVVDYPLRTPLMSVIVAIAGVWFVDAGRGRTPGRGQTRPRGGE